MNVINLIPRGKENAITRSELSNLTNIPDRELREIIKRQCLEQKVLVIGIQGTGGGYYIPTDPSDINDYIRAEHSRAMKILTNVSLAKDVKADMERGVV